MNLVTFILAWYSDNLLFLSRHPLKYVMLSIQTTPLPKFISPKFFSSRPGPCIPAPSRLYSILWQPTTNVTSLLVILKLCCIVTLHTFSMRHFYHFRWFCTLGVNMHTIRGRELLSSCDRCPGELGPYSPDGATHGRHEAARCCSSTTGWFWCWCLRREQVWTAAECSGSNTLASLSVPSSLWKYASNLISSV